MLFLCISPAKLKAQMLYILHITCMSSDVASQFRLRSANRHQLIVPRCRLNTYSVWPSGVFDRRSDGLELAA